MMNRTHQEIHVPNSVYAVQSYNVIASYNNVEIIANVYRENETILTEKEIKDEANAYFLDCGIPEKEYRDLEVEVLRFELDNINYYETKALFSHRFDEEGKDPNGLAYTIIDFDIEVKDTDTFEMRFIRFWDNGLEEYIEEELNWNDVFAFHQGTVIKVLSNEHT